MVLIRIFFLHNSSNVGLIEHVTIFETVDVK